MYPQVEEKMNQRMDDEKSLMKERYPRALKAQEKLLRRPIGDYRKRVIKAIFDYAIEIELGVFSLHPIIHSRDFDVNGKEIILDLKIPEQGLEEKERRELKRRIKTSFKNCRIKRWRLYGSSLSDIDKQEIVEVLSYAYFLEIGHLQLFPSIRFLPTI